MNKLITKKGSVALTLVLVTSSMLLVSGITVLLLSIDLTISSKNVNSRLLADIRSRTCFEESMFRLKQNPSFTGTVEYAYENGNCEGNIAQDAVNANLRVITVSGNLNEYTHNEEYLVDVSEEPFTVL